jgi:hypothetical protein
MSQIILRFVTQVVMKLASARTPIDLYLVPIVRQRELSILRTCWKSIQVLERSADISADLEQHLRDLPETSAQSIERAVTSATLSLLSRQLLRAISLGPTERDDAIDLLSSWISAFRIMKSSLTSWYEVMHSLELDMQSMVVLSAAIYFFGVSHSSSAEDLLDDLLSTNVQKLFKDFEIPLEGPLNGVANLDVSHAIRLARILHEARYSRNNNLARPQQLGEAVQDVMCIVLDDKISDASAPMTRNIERSLVYFFHAIATNSEIMKYLPLSWCAAKLDHWQSSVPPAWAHTAWSYAGDEIANLVDPEGKPFFQYRFDPGLLSSKISPDALKDMPAALQSPAKAPLARKSPLEGLLYDLFAKSIDSVQVGQLIALCGEYAQLVPVPTTSRSASVILAIKQAAVSAMFLRALALTLSGANKPDDISEQWLQSPADVIPSVARRILGTLSKAEADSNQAYSPGGALYLAQPHLFLSLDPESCLRLLQSPSTLKRLGLEQWQALEKGKSLNMSLFPFMVDSTTSVGRLYSDFRSLIMQGKKKEFEDLVASCATDERKRYHYRMFLVLICYYDFFNIKNGCEFIMKMLQDPRSSLRANLLAGLSARELKAFEFVARGTQDSTGYHNLDIISRFGAEAHGAPAAADLTLCSIMVNCLAVAMGSHPTTNHLHRRIFDLGKAMEYHCPGSYYERRNFDCGFSMELDGHLNPGDPAIMPGHLSYRYALNVITWASWAWSLLLEPDEASILKTVQSWMTGDHFLNYCEDEAKSLAYTTASVTARARIYMTVRAQVFLSFLSDHEDIKRSHTHPGMFITQSLHALWARIWPEKGEKVDPRLKVGITKADAIEVENLFYDIFTHVSGNFIHLMDSYLVAARRNKVFASICDLAKLCDGQYRSLLIPTHLITKYTGSDPGKSAVLASKMITGPPEIAAIAYLLGSLTFAF